ncbi:DUF1214 domain-containing protein [Nocardia sp. NPDC050717]|uniref:DUF1214 domain-containing protein n=1 Tax=Nocardia sp. NPDC050717 TaxID=3157221 RepID=UPI0034025087
MQILAGSIAAWLAAHPGERDRVERFLRDRVVPEFREYALTGIAPYVNRWLGGMPADNLPASAVEGYWSIILVSVPDYRVIPNDLHRYNFNDHSPLTYEPDGALVLAVGPEPVTGVPESNWLPSAAGKPFALTFRCYVPKPFVPNGGWAPPPLTEAS